MRQPPVIEALEPRVLYSADAGLVLGLALTPPDAAHHDGNEVVVVDSRLPDVEILVRDIEQQGRDVVMIDAAHDALEQISAALAGRENVTALHVISHGTDGVTLEELQRNPAQAEAWKHAFTADADILLYGCDVAATAEGRLLVDTLARLTGADVAASDNATGSAASGGDWNLEYSTGVIDVSVAPSASAQGAWHHLLANPTQMISGSFTGNGIDDRVITGLGFTPDVVIVFSDAAEIAVIRTSTMAGDLSKPMTGGAAPGANLIQSLAADGFTVGNDARVNANGTGYYWVAFKAGDDMTVGTYVGSGGAQSIAGIGFSPELVLVLPAGSTKAVWHSTADTSSHDFDGGNVSSTQVTSLNADGFSLGTSADVNSNSAAYHYIAFNEAQGVMDVGTYTGDGADNRNITGLGFAPEYLIVERLTGTSNDDTRQKTESSGAGTDETFQFDGSIPRANEIQALQADGFQLGTDTSVNVNGRVYAYLAWRQVTNEPRVTFGEGDKLFTENDAPVLIDAAVTVADPDSADFDGGTLTVSLTAGGTADDRLAIQHVGTGAGQIGISGANVMYGGIVIGTFAGGTDGSTPLVVTFNANATQTATEALLHHVAFENISNTPVEGVRSLQVTLTDGDGYASPTVTKAITVDALMPAATLVISGSYTGDGLDNRAIAGLGFEPDVIIVTPDSGGGGAARTPVIRTSTMAGDVSKDMTGGTALTANLVQSLDVDGFTLGTDAQVNANGITYHWVAFKAGDDMVLGTYTGTGSNQSLTDLGFSPELVFVLGESADKAVFRSSVSNATWDFAGGASSSAQITSLDADGFSLGTNGIVNNNADIYHYIAWNEVAGLFDVGTYTGNDADDRNITGTGLEPEYLIVKRFNAGRDTLHKTESSGAATDKAYYFDGTNGTANLIQALQADGFQVGAANQVNSNGDSYAWFAWRQETAPAGADKAVTAAEDAPYTFTVADFAFSDPDPGESLSAVLIDTLPSAGSLRLSGVALSAGDLVSASDIAAGNLSFVPALDGNGAPYASFTFKVGDEGLGFDATANTMTVNITALNDAPVLNAAQLTVSEGAATVLTPVDFNVTDPDNSAFTYTVSSVAGGSFEVFNGASWNAAASFTTAQLAAGEVRFVDDGDEVAPSFDLTASDGTVNSNTVAATVTYTPANDAPVLNAATLSVSQGQAATLSGADFGITDPDDASFTYAASGITGGYFQLSSNAGVAITSFTSAELAGGLVQFVDDGNALAPAFSVTVNDGDVDSNTLAASVNFTAAVPNAPVVDLNAGGAGQDVTVAFTEQTPVLIAPGGTLTDPDSANLASLTVTLIARPDGDGVESLSLDATASAAAAGAGLTVGYTASSGVLSITGSASVATYQTILQGIQYHNTSDAPSASNRAMTVVANDGTAPSLTQTSTATVTAANDAPLLNAAQLTVSEGGTRVFAPADFSVTDPDSAAFTYTVSGVAGGSFEVFNGATWNAAASFTTAQLAAGEVRFVDDGDEAAPSFNVTANDGTASSNTLAATVTYTPANDAPVLNAAQLTVGEGSATVLTPGDFNVTDPDSAAFTFTVSGVAGGSFEVFNGATWNAAASFTTAQLTAGEVRFVDDGNEAAPSFNVTARDGAASSNTLAATVTYTPANDAPVLNAAQLTVSEGGTTVLAAADFNVTDPDSAAFTYTVSGVAGGSFEVFNGAAWNAAASFTTAQLAVGEVRFVDDGNEVAPSFSVTANDGTASSNTLAATVTYTAVNDAPTATIGPIGYGVVEDDTPRALGGVSIGDVDAASGQIAVTLAVGNGNLILGNTTGLSFTSGANGTASMTFTATVGNANTALATLAYQPDPDFSGTDTLSLSVDDQGNSGSGGPKTASDTASITVSAVNDAPNATITVATFTATEQTGLSLVAGGLSVADVDGPSVTATLSVGEGVLDVIAGATGAAVANSGTGTVTISGTQAQINALLAGASGATVAYTNGSDTPSASTTLTLSATDGTLSASDTATINITAANDAALLNAAQLTVSEGGTRVFAPADFSVTDPDSAAFTYTVSGVAGGSFEVFNGATWNAAASFTTAQLAAGEVRFVDDGNEAAPSFNVTANDGTASSNTLAATVTYTPANDAPVLNAAQLTVGEGSATVLTPGDFNVTDPDSAAFTFTVSGVAGGSFEVFNGATWNAAASFTTAQLTAGEVRFVDDGNEAAPSFNVTARDGAASSNTLAATVTYTPANDAPVLNAAQLTVSEGGTTVLAAADFNVTDPDSAAFTFTVSGVAGGSFQVFDGAAWNAASTFTTAQLAAGEVRFVHNGGEVAPSFSATAGDGAASSNTLAAAVTHTPVNDAPITTASGAGATFTAGGSAVAIDAGVAVADADNATLASATVAITGGFQVAQDGLYFTSNPAMMGNIVGTYNAASGVLTLSSAGASATLAQWQAALGSVTYANAAATPGSATRTVSIAVSDGAAVSAAVSVAVNVASPAPSSTPPPATPPTNLPVVIATPPLPTSIPGTSTAAAAPQPLPQAPQPRVMASLEASLEATGELQIPVVSVSSGGVVQSAAAGGSGVPGVRPGASAGAGPGTPAEADLLAEALTQVQVRPVELFQLEPSRSAGAHPLGGEVARLQESARREEEIQSRTTIVLAAGSLSMTLAYLLWLVRGGALAASVLAALPAWRLVDPLPVLSRARDAEADEADADEAIAAFAEAPGEARRA